MRIGLFTDTYTPDINGVVTSIVTLKKALEEEGHTVFVVANQPSMLSTSYEDGVLRLPGVELKFLYGYTMSSPIHFKAQKIIKGMDLDIIHAHSEFGIGIFARIISKNLHIPLVSTYHTTYEDYTHYVNLTNSKTVDMISKKAVAKMSRMYAKSSEIIISPSRKTKEMLERYDVTKRIEVIPTGLDLKRFQDKKEDTKERIRKQYNIAMEDTLFLYVGRLAKEKSVEFVIEGFKEFLEISQGKLMIVGGGPSEEDYFKLVKDLNIQENVIFTGKVPSEEVVDYYHSADAFVSASLTETQGLTYIEALACGLCVFARPDEPLMEIILDGKTGFFFESYEGFAKVAKEYVDMSTAEKEKIKENGIELANSFSLDIFASAVSTVYQEAINLYHGYYLIKNIELQDEFVIIELENEENNRDTISQIIVSSFVFERRNLEVGMSMSRNEITQIEEDETTYKAFQRALNRIVHRDYSSYEMRDYLDSRLDLTTEQLDVVIDLLIKRRFINDEKFLQDRIDYHRIQLRGNYKIIDDLRRIGFSDEAIYAVLNDESREEYLERGIERANKYLSTNLKGSRRQIEQGLRYHLIRQGYSNEEVQTIISEIPEIVDRESEKDNLRTILLKAQRRYERNYEGQELKDRVIRYCMQKGFSFEDVKNVLEEVENED